MPRICAVFYSIGLEGFWPGPVFWVSGWEKWVEVVCATGAMWGGDEGTALY